jgi:hypothetical protein
VGGITNNLNNKNMYHEKLVVNENGDKVNIRVHFWLSYDKPSYSIDLFICKKGKRKFFNLSFDDYSYRALSMEDRTVYRYNKFKEYVTEEQILEAKNELWNLLSPSVAKQT